MNLKVLFVVFLCLFSGSLFFNATTVKLNAAEGWSCKAFTQAIHTDYLTTNGTEPTGDPIEDPGWPK